MIKLFYREIGEIRVYKHTLNYYILFNFTFTFNFTVLHSSRMK